jgi:hypothetical protein
MMLTFFLNKLGDCCLLTINSALRIFFYHGATTHIGPWPPHCRGFMITLRHTTLGRTCLDEWPARLRDLYPTAHNTQETNIHASDGIRTHNPSKRAGADPRIWPLGHWDRCLTEVVNCYFSHVFIDVRNGPLYRCLSSLITVFTCRCIQYPFLPVLASRTPSYLIHQSFFISSVASCFLWFLLENFPWQSISWHSLYVSKLS